jgi:hypothetical protein
MDVSIMDVSIMDVSIMDVVVNDTVVTNMASALVYTSQPRDLHLLYTCFTPASLSSQPRGAC